jgi:hypothetical protein
MAGEGGSLLWTYAVDGDTTYNYAIFHLDVAETGRYLVEVSTPAPYAMSRQASYRVMHAGTEDRMPLDQTAVDGWSPLGEIELAAGGEQWIRLDDNTGEARDTNTQIVVDAIRLTRVDLPPIDPPPGEDAGTDPPPLADGGTDDGMGIGSAPPIASGCSVTRASGRHGSSSFPGWLFAILVRVGLRLPSRFRFSLRPWRDG